ncbi:MAG: helix-turn-helix transcriptional regulator [Brachyspira sp.]|uniref:Helix-turn-helix transcriptional regulator n=1 Tax=Candidatus Scatousia excrementigallinarum TaxID=2840935 RepID=A0A9D1EZQ5_9BACT|nr:helix-turn-helix transcriptional regulator [Brachyspira sp.]HIS36691.1 helix-turn-helix transcriptional regulator [Candidatus Scatousia excrementigallinarum]
MTNERLKTLGLNIKFARMKKGISQEELAELVDTSRITISFIETARQNPTILKIIDIARALDIDINELIKNV